MDDEMSILRTRSVSNLNPAFFATLLTPLQPIGILSIFFANVLRFYPILLSDLCVCNCLCWCMRSNAQKPKIIMYAMALLII